MTEESLFELTLNTPVAERGAMLDRECAGNLQLRQRVEALIRADAQPEDVLPAQPMLDRTETFAPVRGGSERPGVVIAGKYKLLQQIGEGGMGSVWMADQTEPVKRRVAVKLIRVERGNSQTILARFEAERQAIALMDHPHIARLLDAGTTDDGSPFFVMELVKGVPLTEFCDAHQLTILERLQLFQQICSAVQHAHQKGIIHRDLKPTNILIESHDNKPVPKVIDFGLAKATSGIQLTEHTLFTALGTVAGTPLYMAPEQAKFNAIDIDTRADIYALGVILYELLTGTTPIERETFKKAAFDEMLRTIREQEPPTPSKRLSSAEAKPSVAANRRTEPAKLGGFVRGELDWIVMKALSKERERRYDSATGFAKDIERFLNHEPVQAGPPTAGYRLRKFVQRNRGQVIAASLVLLALLAGIAGTTYGLIRAEIALDAEAEQRGIAEGKEREAVKAANKERLAKEREAAQRAIAVQERTKAEKARDRTRDVLDAMTSEVTGESLSTQKEISEEQKKFLNEVLTYYQEFAGEKADDEQTRVRTAKATYRVGVIEFRLGRKEEGIAAHQRARDGFRTLAADFPNVHAYRRELALCHSSLGVLLKSVGQQEEAEEQYRKGLPIQEKLAADFPTVPHYRWDLARSHNNLGVLLYDLGKHGEAEEQYRKGLSILEKLAADFSTVPDYRLLLAGSHNNLGVLLKGFGKHEEAEEQYHKGLAIQEKLAADFPTVPDYRWDLAASYNNLGALRYGLRKHQEAEEQYRNGLAILEKLAADFPAMPAYRRDLASSHYNLGILLVGLGKPAEAEEQYRKGLAILEKLAADFSTVPDYRRLLASSHNNLGGLLAGLGKRAAAQEQFRNALAIREKLVADFPAVPSHHIDLGRSYGNYGYLVLSDGQAGESLGWFDKAIATIAPVHRAAPRDVNAKQVLRESHWVRARAYDALAKHAEAVQDWDRAIELSPPAEQLELRASRAISRLRAGEVAEAVAEVAELTKSSHWNANQWYDFACVYTVASGKIADKKQVHADRAMELLQKAVQAGYKDAAHIAKDTDLDPLREREDFKKLLAELEPK